MHGRYPTKVVLIDAGNPWQSRMAASKFLMENGSKRVAAIEMPMTEARCAQCGRRLLDYHNALDSGRVIIQKVCERCKTLNVLTLGPREESS